MGNHETQSAIYELEVNEVMIYGTSSTCRCDELDNLTVSCLSCLNSGLNLAEHSLSYAPKHRLPHGHAWA